MRQLVALLAAAFVGGLGTVAVGVPAAGHVTVNPREANQGGYAKVSFRVPNERAGASTVKLEVHLPEATPIASVSLRPVAGWTAQTEKTKLDKPIQRDSGEITEVVRTIVWTADPAAVIKPGQFQEFDVSLGPLPDVDRIVFKALQTYSTGEVVRWIDEPTGGAEPDHPAPVLRLAKANGHAVAVPVANARAAVDAGGGTGVGAAAGIAGLALGLAGLLVGLLAYRKAAGSAS